MRCTQNALADVLGRDERKEVDRSRLYLRRRPVEAHEHGRQELSRAQIGVDDAPASAPEPTSWRLAHTFHLSAKEAPRALNVEERVAPWKLAEWIPTAWAGDALCDKPLGVFAERRA
jgi:hypothetical protein